ncbi:hypothetical protein J4528_10805 [Neisseria subflava]|uniref:hypothetical protein n=1 Tax=Neisseria subflava TaxID=28449 RepID=UPI00202A08E6|nr:hypothetical protein [Neisseria subflava]MCL9792723.1 hypothetical protein [Neisseria subflava]
MAAECVLCTFQIKDSEGVQLHPSYPVHLFKLFTAYDVTDRLNWGQRQLAKPQPHTGRISGNINPAAAAALTQRPYATLDLTGITKSANPPASVWT